MLVPTFSSILLASAAAHPAARQGSRRFRRMGQHLVDPLHHRIAGLLDPAQLDCRIGVTTTPGTHRSTVPAAATTDTRTTRQHRHPSPACSPRAT